MPGSIRVMGASVSGDVDGRHFAGAIASQSATSTGDETSTEQLEIAGVELSLTTDDPTLERATGMIVDGRLTFTDKDGKVTGVYCVPAGAKFTRNTDDALAVAGPLTGLSKAGTCADNKALGSLTFCVQESFLER